MVHVDNNTNHQQLVSGCCVTSSMCHAACSHTIINFTPSELGPHCTDEQYEVIQLMTQSHVTAGFPNARLLGLVTERYCKMRCWYTDPVAVFPQMSPLQISQPYGFGKKTPSSSFEFLLNSICLREFPLHWISPIWNSGTAIFIQPVYVRVWVLPSPVLWPSCLMWNTEAFVLDINDLVKTRQPDFHLNWIWSQTDFYGKLLSFLPASLRPSIFMPTFLEEVGCREMQSIEWFFSPCFPSLRKTVN